VINQAFADAHRFRPGDRLAAIINGRWQNLEITGIALSPEFVYQIKPGDMFPDYKRYGVLWMNRTQLAHAFDMDGAFNDAVLTLTRDARVGDVIDRLDALLAPYGGLGAVSRTHQISHRYLSVELQQLRTMATVFPVIFLSVAAFLLNVVLTRLIGAQRDQIAILKAFGYGNGQIGLHYAQLVLMITLLGLALGVLAGVWLGQHLADIYRGFFHFPFLEYRLRLQVVLIGVAVSVAAAMAGTLAAVRRAAALPPAEGMRPEPPPVFHATLLERMGLQHLFTQPTRIILRNIERRPVKALLSIIGIAMACGILMVGRFQEGAIDYMIKVHYGAAQRDDLTVTFVEPTSRRVLHDLQALPGVDLAEPLRAAAARLHAGHASYRTAIQGIPAHSRLKRVLDDRLRVFELPPEGIVLNDYLAEHLRAKPGDLITVEFLEGRRERREIKVAGVVREFTGVAAYMEIEALNRLLREGPAITGALLLVEPGSRNSVVSALKHAPRVAGVTDRLTAIRNFYESMADAVLAFAFISTVLASSIAFGVVYNSARIALTERSRELASLRVLGFTRGEIAYILLGELALLVLLAIPFGFLAGIALTAYIVHGVESELYRIPLVIGTDVYAFAAITILVSALLSAAMVARRLYHLDLVAVLKTRE